jgi:signal transduction histidine kinase
MIISGSENCSANFEAGAELGTNRERERLSTYFHDQLAPNLMSVAFAVEAIRSELEIENHPAEAKLAKVRDRLSKMLQPIRESILGSLKDSRLDLNYHRDPA